MRKRSRTNRLRRALALTLVGVILVAGAGPATAEADGAVVAWINQNAEPLATTDPAAPLESGAAARDGRTPVLKPQVSELVEVAERNPNLSPLVEGPTVRLPGVRAKVRRDGYRRCQRS